MVQFSSKLVDHRIQIVSCLPTVSELVRSVQSANFALGADDLALACCAPFTAPWRSRRYLLRYTGLLHRPGLGAEVTATPGIFGVTLDRQDFAAFPVDFADETAAGFAGGARSVEGLAGHGQASV